MSDEKPQNPSAPEESSAPANGDAISLLLKRAMSDDGARPDPTPDVLRGVQRKIRERSRGRFFSDGWSTSNAPTRFNHAMVAVVMLVIIGVAYFALAWITVR